MPAFTYNPFTSNLDIYASGADVTGPGSSTNGDIAIFSGTTGNLIADSGVAFPIPVASGGTGLTTLTTAYGTLTAGTTATGVVQNAGTGTTGQVLTSNGAAALPTWQPVTAGDVVGPASATDNALARFDSTTGKLIQNSVGILGDTGNLTGIAALTTSGIVTQGSGQVWKTTSPGAYPYVVLTTDYVILVDTSVARTIQLPNAPTTNSAWVIKDSVGSAGTNNVTVTTVGGAVLIDGAASQPINTNYESFTVIFTGASYSVL